MSKLYRLILLFNLCIVCILIMPQAVFAQEENIQVEEQPKVRRIKIEDYIKELQQRITEQKAEIENLKQKLTEKEQIIADLQKKSAARKPEN